MNYFKVYYSKCHIPSNSIFHGVFKMYNDYVLSNAYEEILLNDFRRKSS